MCYNASAEVIPALSGDSPFPVFETGRGAALFHWLKFTTTGGKCQVPKEETAAAWYRRPAVIVFLALG